MEVSNNISPNGSTNIHNKNVFDKSITDKKYTNFISYAYRSVLEGYAKSQSFIVNNPLEFLSERHKASTINAKIFAEFYSKINSDFKVYDMTLKISTYGMHYFLLDNKALFCFKAMDKKSMINNASTERFDATMLGDDVKLKQSVQKELQKRGIEHQPPIFYIGYMPAENGGIVVKLIRFEGNGIAYDLSLSEHFKSDNALQINIKTSDLGKSKVG